MNSHWYIIAWHLAIIACLHVALWAVVRDIVGILKFGRTLIDNYFSLVESNSVKLLKYSILKYIFKVFLHFLSLSIIFFFILLL